MATLAPIPVAPIKLNGGNALKFHHHLIKLIANLSNRIVIVKKFFENFFSSDNSVRQSAIYRDYASIDVGTSHMLGASTVIQNSSALVASTRNKRVLVK